MSWRKMCCPNTTCAKTFYAVQDVLCPSTASSDKFFDFINHTRTGRITKEELADWYGTNFHMTKEDALKVISSNWHLWDVPKNRSWMKLGFIRSKDQGDLDKEEFPPVHEFMKESLARSLTLTAAGSAPAPNITPAAVPTPPAEASSPASGQNQSHYLVDNSTLRADTRGLSYRSAKELTAKVKPEDHAPWNSYVDGFEEDDGQWLRVPAKNAFLPMVVKGNKVLKKCGEAVGSETRGVKRSHPEADVFTDAVQRHVRQRMLTKAEELQAKLCMKDDKGRQWFNEFDIDKSGTLEKTELINAMLETFKGSHGMSRDQINSTVEGVWDAIDRDGNGSIDIHEFQVLREAMVAQLCSEKVAQHLSRVAQTAA